MKAKRILFKISGILKCVSGGCVLVLFGLMLIVSGLLKDVLMQDLAALNTMIEEVANLSPEYSYFLDYSPEEFVNYILGVINILSIVCIAFSLATITSGIFTLLFARNYDLWLRNRLGKKILFTALDVVFCIGIIAKTLSIIATYLKDKPYQDEIEVKN